MAMLKQRSGSGVSVAAQLLCGSLTFGNAIRVIFLVYVGSSLLYACHYLYSANAPRRGLVPDPSETGRESGPQPVSGLGDPQIASVVQRHPGAEKRVLSDLQSVNWAKQLLLLSNTQGSSTPVLADYMVSKVFGGMKPTKILPYYFKSDSPPNHEEITITTLVTEDRFSVLEQLARHYGGPLSVCIHVNDDGRQDDVLKNLHAVMNRPHMRQFVDVHLVIDIHDRQFNMWRNVARFFARTEFIMMLDVDFFVCTDIRRSVLNNPEHLRLLREWNTAFVVPAFEFADLDEGADASTFPRRKDEVVTLYRSNQLVMFHSGWVRGHNCTKYDKWTETNQTYMITSYQYNYEPYVIMRRDNAAWCDERFIGYGSNKAACLFELYLSGTNFWVLPEDFLIHQTHRYPEDARKHERAYNKKLYQTFREEACFKYARILVANGEWKTPKGRNVRSVCGRIPGFKKAVDSLT